MSFNKSQTKAICHKKGPMLVLAGPGSGKTLVITQRTKYLIEECGVNPRNILVITFTKAAATEMKERFYRLMENERIPVTFGTFHAIYFSILKHAYHYTGSNILREEQKFQFLKDIINKLNLEIDDESEFISGIANEISIIKSDRISLEHYYSVNCSEDIFKQIYKQYESKLERANLLDFDDMLVYCFQLLHERKDILAGWQERFEYILIDEFQDINQIQYDVIKLLAAPENNLFIVGDDDQSIYRFRGARPEIMLNFKKDYPDAKTVLLDTNYRSTKKIVESALRVIKNNKNRYEKDIKTINPVGKEIIRSVFPSQKEENKEIIENILAYIKSGGQFKDIAILFRTNTQPRLLIEKLMEFNIPFKMRDSIPNMYDHWIAKDLISYIHIAMGSNKRGEFLQIINRPKRYVSRECLDNKEIYLDDILEFYKDKDWMCDRIYKLKYDLKLLSRKDPYSAINYIRKGIGYEEYLEEYATFRRIKVEELLDILDEIQESAKNYKTYEEWFTHIEDYGNELKMQVQNRNQNSNSISMATMHSAKGLEYKIVFIIDVNEGIIPHNKAIVEADIEEERRMFYVAMTRAKEMLYLYSVKERYNKKLEISRFVGESLADREELKEGMKVTHIKYKEGIIKKVENGKMHVHFFKPDKILIMDINYCISNSMLQILDSKT